MGYKGIEEIKITPVISSESIETPLDEREISKLFHPGFIMDSQTL